MIDVEIVEHLLLFHELKRTTKTKIKLDEADRFLIAKACRLHLIQKVEIKRGKTKRLHGWRFTPLGNSFLQLISDMKKLKLSVRGKESEIQGLELINESLAGEERRARDKVVSILEQLGPATVSYLMQTMPDALTRTRMRELFIALIELGKARAKERKRQNNDRNSREQPVSASAAHYDT